MTANPFLELDPQDILAITRALVDTPSVSKSEENLCNLIEEWVSQLRPDAKLTRVRNNLVVQIGNHDLDLPVILAGHIDTVPPATIDGVSNQISRIEGDRLIGLGTSDMKSGVAVMLCILAEIQIASTFIFYECEEIAEEFSGLRHLAQNNAALLKGKWAILLEPTNGQIELGCQGSITVEAQFNGVRAHSARPWMGQNAIHKAVKTLQNGLRESTNQPPVEIEGLTYTPALQMTMIEGGISRNVIPDYCKVTINHRFAPNVSPEQAESYVREQVCEDCDDIQISSIAAGAMPAMEHPLVSFAKSKNIELVPKIGWTDVARFAALDIPAVNCGPGDALMCHRADEYIDIEKLHEGYNFIKEFIFSL